MKAFVIKNKEGKYFQWLFNDEPDWEDKLYNGFMHYSKEDAEKSIIQWQLENCEVVEITIAETEDLEQDIRLDNAFWKQECDSLQKTLAEKYKEIEELEAYKKGAYEKYVSKCAYLQQQIKDTRKQVCDEVRNIIDYYKEWYEQGYIIDMREEDLLKEIDKIEQAKEITK